MSQYLLEIGLEELPARFIPMLSQQLADLMGQFLDDKRLTYDSIEKFSTPRRLSVRVNGLADCQEDISTESRGPSLKIAKDESGEWTKAAQGFARGQGLTPDELIIKEVKGEDYVFAEKFEKGLETSEVLKDVVEVVKKVQAPVSMRWNTYKTEYIRPIHWFVSLLNEVVVPFSYVGVEAGRISYGHRFLGEDVEIKSADSYEKQLEEEYVIASFDTRKEIIESQIKKLAEDNNWSIPIAADLLEEVTGIVEYPTAFYGQFEGEYLKVPEIILVTAMRDHQRYFPVFDKETDKLLPYFISVRNGNSQNIEIVVKGNQKVLKARLEDALFFYEDDLKRDINDFNDELKSVNEHAKIGTLSDKEERVGKLVIDLADNLKNSNLSSDEIEAAKEAAVIYKFDLMTGVVNEFSELQGEIGAIYAQSQGIDEMVCDAIRTQYLPNQSGGSLPDTKAGSLLALADKFDTLINFFKVGIIPTGSNDPFALRRQATGIVEILISNDWELDLDELFSDDLMSGAKEGINLKNELIDFINARLEKHLQRAGVDHDIIQSVLKSDVNDIIIKDKQAQALQSHKNSDREGYNSIIEALSRVVNLGIKVESIGEIDKNLIESESESQLLKVIEDMPEKDYEDKFSHLIMSTTIINQYFEENMVNHEDEKIKTNRQNTMGQLTEAILSLFDPRELITKGK